MNSAALELPLTERDTRAPGLFRSAWLLLRKDLLLEWRTRARANAIAFFGGCTLLLFSFAIGPDTELLSRHASGFLWLALLFSTVLALGESFRIESDNGCLDGLRLMPADARALFLGKALGNALVTFALAWVLVPVAVALYGVHPAQGFFKLAAVLALGCMAISAPGAVHAAICSHARAKDVLLPLLLFPLIIPALLAAVKATALVLNGDPMGQLGGWLGLLAGFNLTYWSLGIVLFPKVIEE